MDYNLVGIRQRVRIDKLDDEEYDSTVIDNFINDTQRDIFNRYELPFQEKIFQGTILGGAAMFELPKDLTQLQYQTLSGVSGFTKSKMDWEEFFETFPDNTTRPAGNPSAWTLYAGNMILDKPVDKDYVLTLFYIKSPKILKEDTDVPEVPKDFEELLVLGAYIRVLKRNEDYDQASAAEIEYNRISDLLAIRYGLRSSGGFKMKNQQVKV